LHPFDKKRFHVDRFLNRRDPCSLPGKPQTAEFDHIQQQDGGGGFVKSKLVQYEHKLPPLAKPPTPAITSRKPVDDKVPLKSALNGMTDVSVQQFFFFFLVVLERRS
jgi:hypothetical protein